MALLSGGSAVAVDVAPGIYRLVIKGAPRTKKNHGQIVFKRVPTPKLPAGLCLKCRRGSLPILLPSESFQDYEKIALPQLRDQWRGREPLTERVYVHAVFYRDVASGDLVGFHQALADILEAAKVIENDRLVRGWPVPEDGDDDALRKDARDPRTELVIRVLPPPKEVQARMPF